MGRRARREVRIPVAELEKLTRLLRGVLLAVDRFLGWYGALTQLTRHPGRSGGRRSPRRRKTYSREAEAWLRRQLKRLSS
jgi:hypothetical protein